MPKFDANLGEKKKSVNAIGPKDADVVILGEAPGRTEVLKGKPFVGSSGRLLNQMLDKVGIKRHRCYITNVVKTRPPKNDFKAMYYRGGKPTKELENAWECVKEEIREVNPNITIAVGGEAARAIMEDPSASIQNWRGSIVDTSVGKVIFTYHPAFIMRMYYLNPIMLFDLKKAKRESRTPDYERPKRNIVTKPTKKEVLSFIEHCKESEYLSFDIETKEIPESSAYPEEFQGEWFIDCIGIAPSDDYGLCIPLEHEGKPYWSITDEIEILRALADLMSDYSIKKIAQNAQYDIMFLERLGIPVNNLWFDTMNAAAVVYPEFPKSLAFLVSIYTEEPFYKHTSDEERWIYNGKDTTCTYEVAFGLLRDLKEIEIDHEEYDNLNDFYFNHIHELVRMYLGIQQFGVKIDQEEYQKVKKKIEKNKKEQREELKEIIGKEVNVNPSNSLREFLYEDLGAKERRTNKGTLKTDEDTLLKIRKECSSSKLESIKKHADTITKILDLRKVRDAESSHIKAKQHSDGRMRCTFKVSGTETGRLSSSKSYDKKGRNLQNVEKEYRSMYVPDDGFIFLGGDLSQAENRCVAYLSEDQKMIQVVESEGDIHRQNAAMIFDKPLKEITSHERSLGKRITHASNYMVGPRTFAQVAGISVAKAKIYLQKYYNTYPRVKLWHKEIIERLRKDRTLVNPFGRRRYFNDRLNDATFRKAVAFLPQSTVADCLHRATLNCYALLPHPARLVLNLHDEFFIQVPDDEESIKLCEEIMKKEIERPFTINGYTISIPTEIKKGYNWKEVS